MTQLDEGGGSALVASRITLKADPTTTARYQWLARLVAPSPSDVVVDFGCGDGFTIKQVAGHLDAGLAIGIDNDIEALQATLDSSRLTNSRLAAIQADLMTPLPLQDASVDVALSHDVLELLPDAQALLGEIYRVVRPGGRLVLGHADFDTAVFAGADLALTRRLVHTFCDTQQAWMTSVDGTIGRRLPEIINQSSFTLEHVTARVLLSRSLEEGQFGRFAIDYLTQALHEAGVVPSEELDRWRTQLEAAALRDAFMVSLNDYVVTARRGGEAS